MKETNVDYKDCSRREFLRRSTAGTGTIILGSIWLEACADSPNEPASTGATISIDTKLSQYSALAQIGGTLALNENDLPDIPSYGLLIIREAEESVRALSRRCPHKSCIVQPFANEIANCDCHGSQFDKEGKVLKGPASASLFAYNASIEDGIISISV
tara:strand:- start:9013 stop:9486 length:474 start_codon:yes stop_codon:yes gene_type:complete